MKRRGFIKSSIATSTLLSSKLSLSNILDRERSPNIVLILTDQLTAKALSCYGNKHINTSNIDFLAQNGTRYTQCYCTQPLCGPSRSAMFTGRYPHQIDATVNRNEIPNYWNHQMPFLGRAMREAGYETAYIGKWHLPMPSTDSAFHGFDYIRNTTRRDWQDASIPADCGSFLKQNHKKPFFMVASFVNPHDICEWARGQKLRMDEISLPPSPNECPPLPNNYEVDLNEPSFLRAMMKSSPKQYPTTQWDDNHWRQYIWAYYQLVQRVDIYVGHVIESLRRTQHLEDSVIVFTSDHGDGVASHHWNQKQVLYNEVVNIPLIVSEFYKNSKSKVNSNTLVNMGIDLFPTLLDYVQRRDEQREGESFKPNNPSIESRDFIVIETEFAENDISTGITGRSLIDRNYKYTLYSQGDRREQLFDLKRDFGEQNNLALNKKYQTLRQEYREKLSKWASLKRDSTVQIPI